MDARCDGRRFPPRRDRRHATASPQHDEADFRGPIDWRQGLLRVAGRHPTLAVEIRDPREQELTDVGDLWLVDPETGRQVRVDTRSRSLRERFAHAAEEEGAVAAEVIAGKERISTWR